MAIPYSRWTKFNREQAEKVLQQLSGHKDAAVFAKDYTEVSSCQLPFYTNYWLCRLVNYASMPSLSMIYLTDGVEYISLDGTANPIYTANEKAPIELTEINVIPYLDFFFGNVEGTEGDVILIKDPKKTPFMDTLSPAQQESFMKAFRHLQIVKDSSGNFRAVGTIYYAGSLINTTIIIQPDGKMAFDEQHPMMSGIAFHDSPYGQTWQ